MTTSVLTLRRTSLAGRLRIFFQEAGAAPPDSDEVDFILAQSIRPGVGGHFAVHVEPIRFDSGEVFPVLDETQRQEVFLSADDVGVRVTEHGAVHGAGETGFDARDGFAA